MNAASDDRKTAAIIRDVAMELFAERGAAGVTIREVASAAGVSPGLVMHHFGSRDGLKDAVDRRAAEFMDEMAAEFTRLGQEDGAASLARLLSDRLEREPALTGYLRRLLVDGGEAAATLFERLLAATVHGMRSLVAAGVVRPAPDEDLRAVFLLSNDLAMFMLHAQIQHATGIDPLSRDGLARWTAAGLDVYSGGLFTPPAAPGPRQTHQEREGRP